MVMEILERAREMEREGRDIVHMEVGEPDFPTPQVIVRAMKDALDQGLFGYTHSLGDPVLREALSSHYKDHYGLDIDPGRFFVCPGTSAGLTILFGAILEPGDPVLLSNPHYSCYPNFVRFFSGRPVAVDSLESDGFRPDPGRLGHAIRAMGGVRAILANSPANPTGQVLEPSRMEALAKLPGLMISDEIYHGLSYHGGRDRSMLEFSEDAVVVGGFSKAFAMTGWRVGYLVLPQWLVRPVQTLAQNFLISVNAAAQRAAAVALKEAWPEVIRMRETYDRRRRFLLGGLSKLGLKVAVEPTGAFYALADARHLSTDSRALAFEILEEAGVGTTPGIDFGGASEGFLRFSYATSIENIGEGLRRLGDFIGRRRDGNANGPPGTVR
jgi:aspartate/methionine/tyrosine aminotransferase